MMTGWVAELSRQDWPVRRSLTTYERKEEPTFALAAVASFGAQPWLRTHHP